LAQDAAAAVEGVVVQVAGGFYVPQQIMTGVSAQKSWFHSRAAAATVADLVGHR
jgi:hypothetical protein